MLDEVFSVQAYDLRRVAGQCDERVKSLLTEENCCMVKQPSYGVTPDEISPYLRHWNLEEEDPGKAFPDDRFEFHDCWQMCDFMRKIGLRYPLDDAGQILGETYEFIMPKKIYKGK